MKTLIVALLLTLFALVLASEHHKVVGKLIKKGKEFAPKAKQAIEKAKKAKSKFDKIKKIVKTESDIAPIIAFAGRTAASYAAKKAIDYAIKKYRGQSDIAPILAFAGRTAASYAAKKAIDYAIKKYRGQSDLFVGALAGLALKKLAAKKIGGLIQKKLSKKSGKKSKPQPQSDAEFFSKIKKWWDSKGKNLYNKAKDYYAKGKQIYDIVKSKKNAETESDLFVGALAGLALKKLAAKKIGGLIQKKLNKKNKKTKPESDIAPIIAFAGRTAASYAAKKAIDYAIKKYRGQSDKLFSEENLSRAYKIYKLLKTKKQQE